MKWKNLKGTGDNQASKPWLDIWKERTGYKGNPPCGRKGCSRAATLGAHVIKVDSGQVRPTASRTMMLVRDASELYQTVNK